MRSLRIIYELTESTSDVFFGLSSELDWKRFSTVAVEFDQPPEIKESGVIRATARLLHVVRDDDDGVFCVSTDG